MEDIQTSIWTPELGWYSYEELVQLVVDLEDEVAELERQISLLGENK